MPNGIGEHRCGYSSRNAPQGSIDFFDASQPAPVAPNGELLTRLLDPEHPHGMTDAIYQQP